MKQIILLTKTWVILLGFTLAFQATAEETTANRNDAIPIMEDVIVTATKIPGKRKDIPNAVVIMDANDIATSSSASLEYLLANEAGLDGRSYGDYPGAAREIHIRGFRGNGTQVLVNGVPVNSPSLGLTDFGKIPLNSIERIEVVKGSGSVLYGSGAMGGVVSIFTPSPQKGAMDLKIHSGYGSHNTYNLGIAQGMFITDTWGYYLTVNRTETAGDRSNSFLRQSDVSFKLAMDGNNEALKINFYGNYLSRDYGIPGVHPPKGTQEYQFAGETFFNSESASLTDRGKDRDTLLSLELTGSPLSWLEYKLQGHYLHMENENYMRYLYEDWFSPGTIIAEGSETEVINKVAGVSGHVNLKPFTGADLLMGGDYCKVRWENNNTPLDAKGSRITTLTDKTKADVSNHGFFSELQYRPSPYGKILAGVRHEQHSEFGSINLPFFGVIINPFTNTSLKVNHGRHFLAPTPNDLFWPDDGIYTKGNPDLRPETGWHTDVTLEQSLLQDRLFFSLSYFRWHVDDKIQWVLDENWIYTPFNLFGYKAQGFEAGIKAALTPAINLGLNYTYLDAEEEDMVNMKIVKRRAAYTPRGLFKGNLTWRTESGLMASATVRYTGNRLYYTGTDTHTLESYWTGDLQVEQRFLKHFILSLSLNNITNSKYDTRLGTFYGNPLAGSSQLCGYPGSGRFMFLRLTYNF